MSKTKWNALLTTAAKDCEHTSFRCLDCGSVVYGFSKKRIDVEEFERLARQIQEGVEESGLSGEEESGSR